MIPGRSEQIKTNQARTNHFVVEYGSLCVRDHGVVCAAPLTNVLGLLFSLSFCQGGMRYRGADSTELWANCDGDDFPISVGCPVRTLTDRTTTLRVTGRVCHYSPSRWKPH